MKYYTPQASEKNWTQVAARKPFFKPGYEEQKAHVFSPQTISYAVSPSLLPSHLRVPRFPIAQNTPSSPFAVTSIHLLSGLMPSFPKRLQHPQGEARAPLKYPESPPQSQHHSVTGEKRSLKCDLLCGQKWLYRQEIKAQDLFQGNEATRPVLIVKVFQNDYLFHLFS